MSSARHLELTPDEVFLEEALRSGKAIKTEISMKALGKPDVQFQARVIHLDMTHVHRLSMNLENQGFLAHVVVFRDTKGKLCLADGFHRHECYRKAGKAAIPAYQVTGDRNEAIEFAAMCNRQNCLGRTKDDERKAIKMLLNVPAWFRKRDQDIADHVGATVYLVAKCREEFSIETGTPIPAETKYARGEIPKTNLPRKGKNMAPGTVWQEGEGKKKVLKTFHKGQPVKLPSDPRKAAREAKRLAEKEHVDSVTARFIDSLIHANPERWGKEPDRISSKRAWSRACPTADCNMQLEGLVFRDRKWLCVHGDLTTNEELIAMVGVVHVLACDNDLLDHEVFIIMNGDTEWLQKKVESTGFILQSPQAFLDRLQRIVARSRNRATNGKPNS